MRLPGSPSISIAFLTRPMASRSSKTYWGEDFRQQAGRFTSWCINNQQTVKRLPGSRPTTWRVGRGFSIQLR